MLRQMSKGSSALHIERLKGEKQAQGKIADKIIFYSLQVNGNEFPFSVKTISEKAGWLMRMGVYVDRNYFD